MLWCLYLRTLSNSALSRPASMDSKCSLWVTCSKRAAFSFSSTSSLLKFCSFSFFLHSLAAASWFLRALISSWEFREKLKYMNPECKFHCLQHGQPIGTVNILRHHKRILLIICIIKHFYEDVIFYLLSFMVSVPFLKSSQSCHFLLFVFLDSYLLSFILCLSFLEFIKHMLFLSYLNILVVICFCVDIFIQCVNITTN